MQVEDFETRSSACILEHSRCQLENCEARPGIGYEREGIRRAAMCNAELNSCLDRLPLTSCRNPSPGRTLLSAWETWEKWVEKKERG